MQGFSEVNAFLMGHLLCLRIVCHNVSNIFVKPTNLLYKKMTMRKDLKPAFSDLASRKHSQIQNYQVGADRETNLKASKRDVTMTLSNLDKTMFLQLHRREHVGCVRLREL